MNKTIKNKPKTLRDKVIGPDTKSVRRRLSYPVDGEIIPLRDTDDSCLTTRTKNGLPVSSEDRIMQLSGQGKTPQEITDILFCGNKTMTGGRYVSGRGMTNVEIINPAYNSLLKQINKVVKNK